MEIFLSIVVIIAIVITIIIKVKKAEKDREREKILNTPFSEEWRDYLKKNMALYSKLPEDIREKLEKKVQLFIFEKPFEGYKGVEITDEIKVTIAAQACLLILNKKNYLYPKLFSISVFPSSYSFTDGEKTSIRLGESWSNGKLIVSWKHSIQDSSRFKDGQNVVFHEFAHQLDQEDGDADGVPILEGGYPIWDKTFKKEYKSFLKQISKNKKTLMDHYGATNPAEFFAVATETFFEKGKQMEKKHPELYKMLKNYYKLDTASWDI